VFALGFGFEEFFFSFRQKKLFFVCLYFLVFPSFTPSAFIPALVYSSNVLEALLIVLLFLFLSPSNTFNSLFQRRMSQNIVKIEKRNNVVEVFFFSIKCDATFD